MNVKGIQEGTVKNERSFKFWGVAVAIVAIAVLAATGFQGRRFRFEKVSPISFVFSQDSDLVKNCAAKVEKDNVKLSKFLSDLREVIQAAMKERKSFDPAAWAKSHPNPFAGTYLDKMKLTTEDGTTLTLWEDIVTALTAVINKSTYIDAQSVHVNLEYLVYKSPRYLKENGSTAPALADEFDFIAHIKTVLAYAPQDDPLTADGELRHRKTCVYEPVGD
jgi:hypothetical protein